MRPSATTWTGWTHAIPRLIAVLDHPARRRPEARRMPVHDVGAGQPRARALALSLPDHERTALAERARATPRRCGHARHAAWAAGARRIPPKRRPHLRGDRIGTARGTAWCGADDRALHHHPSGPGANPVGDTAGAPGRPSWPRRRRPVGSMRTRGWWRSARWAGVPAGTTVRITPRGGELSPTHRAAGTRRAGRGPRDRVARSPTYPQRGGGARRRPEHGLRRARRFEAGWIADLLQVVRATLAAIAAVPTRRRSRRCGCWGRGTRAGDRRE